MKNSVNMKIKFDRLLENIRKKRETEKKAQCKVAEGCGRKVSYYDLPDVCYEDEE